MFHFRRIDALALEANPFFHPIYHSAYIGIRVNSCTKMKQWRMEVKVNHEQLHTPCFQGGRRGLMDRR